MLYYAHSISIKIIIKKKQKKQKQKKQKTFQVGLPRQVYKSPTHQSQPSHFNHDSALRHTFIVTDKLHQESAAGRMAGPYFLPPLPGFQVSPLALVEGSFRLIHNLSYP